MTAKQQLAEYQRAINWYFSHSGDDYKSIDAIIRQLVKAFEVSPHVALVPCLHEWYESK